MGENRIGNYALGSIHRLFEDKIQQVFCHIIMSLNRRAQIHVAWSPRRPNFLCWRLILAVPQDVTCAGILSFLIGFWKISTLPCWNPSGWTAFLSSNEPGTSGMQIRFLWLEFPPSLDNVRSQHGHINQRLQIQFGVPDDERYAARNILSLQ
jgi:hypothetical protein